MPEKKEPDAITAISVKGFKSFADETRLEIRPLTLLAGANSSGKSSAMQPLLLLKQTLEATYDPGPLLLSGSHVRFTSAFQVLHKRPGRAQTDQFQVGFESSDELRVVNTFRRDGAAFGLAEMEFHGWPSTSWIKAAEIDISLREGMETAEIARLLPGVKTFTWELQRERCFLQLELMRVSRGSYNYASIVPLNHLTRHLYRIIHVSSLRGNPSRMYQATAAGEAFSGTFDNYVASVIASWQRTNDPRLESLCQAMEALGLSWRVTAKDVDAIQVELLVARLPRRRHRSENDLVNIADVGFGVSTTLPVLVALTAGSPGQLVYLEEPEIHLHPRAQEALAGVLAEAAGRGVQVVAETHSSILLLAVQALVAEGKLDPDKVKLHWFQRGDDGVTKVTSADLDPQGAYGDWPEDFGEVRAQAENRYLDAVEAKAFPPKKPKRNAKSR